VPVHSDPIQREHLAQRAVAGGAAIAPAVADPQPAAPQTLQQALNDSTTSSDIAYCRYYLGELAFNSGQLDEAERQYQAGMAVDAGYPALQQGLAKVAAARGNLDAALTGYQRLTQQMPLPQYIAEYAELLTVAGRGADAKAPGCNSTLE